MAVFDWMDEARERVNHDPDFHALGSADMTIAFKSGKHIRVVEFEDFGVNNISVIEEAELDEYDVVVAMASREWSSYLYRRKIRTAPSLQGMDLDKKIIHAKTPMARRHFDRIHLTVQAFVDTGATL